MMCREQGTKEGGSMTITRLGETKKGRFSVFADGEFLFSVHKDIFLSRKELELGREVSVELL